MKILDKKLRLTSKQILNELEKDWFEERAAILEYEAGLPRGQAERIARQELLESRSQKQVSQAS